MGHLLLFRLIIYEQIFSYENKLEKIDIIDKGNTKGIMHMY